MKTLRLISITAFFVVAAASFSPLSAQTPLPKCKAAADQIYFVASGQQVSELHPGGNGYQLNILGNGANKFTLVREPHMTSVSLITGYTNDTAAKWQVYFNPRMGRQVRSVMLRSECKGRVVDEYPLTVTVTLLDQ